MNLVLLAVQVHVSRDQVTRRECGDEGDLTCEDTGADEASKLASILARLGRVATLDAEQSEGSGLR